MVRDQYRSLVCFGAFLIAFLLASAYYMELQMGLEPCPLCIMQRVALVLILVGFIPGMWVKSLGLRRFLAFFSLLASGFGIYLASRQLWLQNLPKDQIPECLPDVGYMFEILPATEFLQHMLSGTGDCAEVSFRFLGLTIPGYTLISFTVLFFISLIAIFKARSAQPTRRRLFLS